MDYKLLAFVKRGTTRKDILKIIFTSKKTLTANEIREKLKISLSQVSRTLNELSDKNLIICLNPDDNIGKLYKISKLGEEIFNEI